MQLDWLETFIDVSETRNFNRTAERLEITQSTVSSRIRSLEEALGARLFVRGRGGATLTAEGAKFLSYANDIRLSWNLALQELGQPENYVGTLRVATQMSIWEQLVNEWIAWIREHFPETAIHVEADYSKNMVDELLFGNLDIAVLYAPEYKSNLEVEHLFNEQFTMVSTTPMHINNVTRENYVFVALTEYFKVQHSKLLPHLQTGAISMGLGIMSLEYLKQHGGAAYISQRQARQLAKEEMVYLVEDAPTIEQPVFTAYLSKHRHKLIVIEALKALRRITEQ